MSLILQKLDTKNLLPEEKKRLMRKKFDVGMSDRNVEYRAEGGNAGNPHVDGSNAVADKVNQARKAGVSESKISQILKNNAMKTRDAKVRGALLGGGLQTVSKTSANIAGLITQAGVNNESFTPEPTLGGASQGIKEAGHAEGQYQEDLSQIERDEQARTEAETEATTGSGSPTNAYTTVRVAMDLVGPASQAGDIVNGYKLTADQQKTLDNATAESDGWVNNTIEAVSTAASTVAGAFSATEKVRMEALRKIAINQAPESYTAYVRLNKIAKKLALEVLSTQKGSKSDFEFRVSAESIFDITSPSSSWMAMLQDVLDDIRRVNPSQSKAFDNLDAKYPVTEYTPVTNSSETTEPESSFEEAEFENMNSTPFGHDAGEAQNSLVDNVVETVSGGVDSLVDGSKGLFEDVKTAVTSEDDNDTKITYPKDEPLMVPKRLANLKFGAFYATLAWLLTQTLSDNDFVSFKGEVGTYAEFKES